MGTGKDAGFSPEFRKQALERLRIVLTAFYDHVRVTPEARRFFSDASVMDHAAEMQIRHWTLLLEGRLDEDYFASARRIGEVHNRLGLDTSLYLEAYGFILSRLVKDLSAPGSRRFFTRRKQAATAQALERLIALAVFDMSQVIAVYTEAGQKDRTRALAELGDLFRQSIGAVSDELETMARGLTNSAECLIDVSSSTEQGLGLAERGSNATAENINTVAVASEELTSSVGEIGRQVQQSYAIAEEATSTSTQAIETMSQLTQAAGRVGEIISLINDIAAKTNLLALNATIEAARAGEAGRGFAVVATEVKDLADQTARATAEIAAQVEEIQTVTASSATALEEVHATIRRLNEIAAVINDAVDQQGAATREISSNIQLAANGAGEASSAILAIGEGARRTFAEAGKVREGMSGLSGQARRLQEVSASFLQKVAAS
ncbi:methyl-accepting chemotaxis protein [Roseibium aestuarii]